MRRGNVMLSIKEIASINIKEKKYIGIRQTTTDASHITSTDSIGD